MPLTARLNAVVTTFVIAGAVTFAQQQRSAEAPPTFRVQVDAIEVDAFVTDASGNPVSGLTAADFEIVEEGAPQTITSFAQIEIPFVRQTAPLDTRGAVERDVQTNDNVDGRLYMFAFDEISPLQAVRARTFLRSFLADHFAANDQAAVVFIGQQSTAPTQPFTSDRRLIMAAIDRASGGFAREAVLDSPTQTAPAPAVDSEGQFIERRRMADLRGIAEMMATLRGRRKALLLISENLPESIFRAIDYNGGTLTLPEESAHAAVVAATRGNVTIYPIDPRGLTGGGTLEGEAPPAAAARSELDERMSLSMLARVTGGFAITNTNSFEGAFDRIVREGSVYYLLGFTSTHERRDGRFRKLVVRVNRPGLQVRAREGYVAPLKNERLPVEPRPVTGLSAAASGALTNPLPGGTVPIRVFAAPYVKDRKTALVAIVAEVDAKALGLKERDGVHGGELEIGFLATDPKGKIYPGQHFTMDLALKAETYDAAARYGMRVLSEIQLPPGRFQLRLVAGNNAGKAGNVVYDIVVPDFTKEPLMLSGIALTSASMTGAATVGVRHPVDATLPRPPTAVREFGSDDTLALAGEVYENRSKGTQHRVTIRADLIAPDGTVARGADAEGTRFRVDLPLAGLTPGSYDLRVVARSAAVDRAVSRSIAIRIR